MPKCSQSYRRSKPAQHTRAVEVQPRCDTAQDAVPRNVWAISQQCSRRRKESSSLNSSLQITVGACARSFESKVQVVFRSKLQHVRHQDYIWTCIRGSSGVDLGREFNRTFSPPTSGGFIVAHEAQRDGWSQRSMRLERGRISDCLRLGVGQLTRLSIRPQTKLLKRLISFSE